MTVRTEKQQKHYDIDRALDAEVAASADATNQGAQSADDHAKRVEEAHAVAKDAHAELDQPEPAPAPRKRREAAPPAEE